MYHRFGEDRFPSTSVTIEQFEQHLEHIEQAGYKVWPLERIAAYLLAEQELPDKIVGMSIDDAYASIYEKAWPRLRERDLPFTVFVATDEVDRGGRPYMTWEQMREMAAAGVHFANHSSTHDKLHERKEGESKNAWQARVRADIANAEQRLREELGDAAIPSQPRLFAYPYGEYDSALEALVEEMGYVGFGQHSGAIGAYSSLTALPRFPMAVAYAELAEFRQKAATFALPLTAIEPRDPVIGANNPPRFEARLGEVNADPRRLACFASRQGALEIEWIDRERRHFAVQAPQAYRPGRARYNCTLPSNEAGRFYWYSQPWIVPGGSH
ncbi:hypothetical protein CAI21_11405 [Alkalilimnicola ehrlichii]|uniref:NodB homology domain-containing protein n=1 Tax=Alkalilimnicola ehrlichii TaxID=351052 RepID=A0A3E0X2T9_9GAMM|nr:polysaccharide deacetylase family protein [Alkalilimnicola ehrlichii]RFA29044.1 hypothetical protein CAI21_11405 [Alkalilimnicola ehrlichii]RFA38682.1 hypothetical protein CAL65_04965 [Alkalilimnicola ehrlichii]